MRKVLVCIDDIALSDLIRTAFKQAPNMTAMQAPTERLLDLVIGEEFDAVVMPLHDGSGRPEARVSRIRELNREIEVLPVIERRERDGLRRLKVEQGLFSFICLLLDPIEIGRTVLRLERHLRAKQPATR